MRVSKGLRRQKGLRQHNTCFFADVVVAQHSPRLLEPVCAQEVEYVAAKLGVAMVSTDIQEYIQQVWMLHATRVAIFRCGDSHALCHE